MLMGWLDRHGKAVQAIIGVLTLIIALGALIGVKIQIDATARLQREQSARDIYREYLSLSIANPDFSDPDYCALAGSKREAAYASYVEYMLYTFEQALDDDSDWTPAFADSLSAHENQICAMTNWSGYGKNVMAEVTKFRARQCGKPLKCSTLSSETF